MEKAYRKNFSKARFLVVGDPMLDSYWLSYTNRISPEEPVPVIHVGKIHDPLGGTAKLVRNESALGSPILRSKNSEQI